MFLLLLFANLNHFQAHVYLLFCSSHACFHTGVHHLSSARFVFYFSRRSRSRSRSPYSKYWAERWTVSFYKREFVISNILSSKTVVRLIVYDQQTNVDLSAYVLWYSLCRHSLKLRPRYLSFINYTADWVWADIASSCGHRLIKWGFLLLHASFFFPPQQSSSEETCVERFVFLQNTWYQAIS